VGDLRVVGATRWSVATFGVLLLLAIILFVAGGVILPSGHAEYPSDLREYFERDGKWGVVAIASYGIAGTLGNLLLFGALLWIGVILATPGSY
jgi:hypothetical protein